MNIGTQGVRDFKYQVLLVMAAIAAWGPVIVINQALWDDWVLLSYSETGAFWEFFKQMGRREQYFLAAPFAALGEPRVWTTAALVLSCSVPPMVYTIIRRTTQWAAADAFWAALLTGLVPLNQARFILSTIPYAFSSFFFLLALLLLQLDLSRSFVLRRLAIIILLVMAFSTNSFLVLAWVAPAIVALHGWRRSSDNLFLQRRASATVRAVMARSELLLLPFIYWPAKQMFEPSYGLYANYNKFRMSVPAGLKQVVLTFIDQLRDAGKLVPNEADLPDLIIAAAITIAIFTIMARLLRLSLASADDQPDSQSRLAAALTLGAAAALGVCALFPYVMVGQPPRFSGLWETRHQTTLMLTSGFAIVALLRLIAPGRFLWRAASVIGAAFLLLDMSFAQGLIRDARETSALLEAFKQHPSVAGTMMLVLEDDREYRALGRFFPFYELSFLVNGGKSGPNLAISESGGPRSRDRQLCCFRCSGRGLGAYESLREPPFPTAIWFRRFRRKRIHRDGEASGQSPPPDTF
ncbi:hypothetical protein [Bradyrhizobium lupini]|uniref:hypothetical protein n=1 Tax=Rhizobium lupini TaxID=136996 RepID=UPI0034C5CAD7